MSMRGVPSKHTCFYDHDVCQCFGSMGTCSKCFYLQLIKEDAGIDNVLTCGVQKHAKKFVPKRDLFYLKGNEVTAFCQPSFPSALVLDEFQADIQSSKKTIDEWKAFFAPYQETSDLSTMLGTSSIKPKIIFITPCKRTLSMWTMF